MKSRVTDPMVGSLLFASRPGDWSWQSSAACAGMELSVFFGDSPEPMPARRRREAKGRAVCARCPVQRPCLQFALRHRIRDGLWGGLVEQERAQLTRKLRARILTS